MIEFELDGKTVAGEPGATILEVALKEGKYIPHFCYHKKLSIAANCRMCLVEVEKARGPAPACATPITEGMKVHTCSKLAVEAQKGVMEFLLINHPLDCPICDQGGECQLQDLAVGYGRSASRYNEEKRAVANHDLGPLVRPVMTRCIHCSRCVRFTDEIAGFQELGMSYRNNHVEVMPFIGQTVNSELSGNIIDICPVGALTSKPFRDSARSWELSRRKSISPHDALGSNLQLHIDKYHKVVRVLPLENEAINECWLSDRDRFSYEGLYHKDRVTNPMIKQDGQWHNVDWDTALNYAAKSIVGVKSDHGSDAIGVLASAVSTCEELHILQKMMRALGVNNLDYRLERKDFSLDAEQAGVAYLGSSIAELSNAKSILVIGSILREEHPLLAQRLRQAAKRGTELHIINLLQEDLLADITTQITLDPRDFAELLAQILKAATQRPAIQLPAGPESISKERLFLSTKIDLSTIVVSAPAEQIAASLVQQQGHILLGRVAQGLDNYGELLLLCNAIAEVCGGTSGILPSLANEVGAQLVGFLPYRAAFNGYHTKGLNAREMLEQARQAYILLNTELELDSFNSGLALAALNQAATVVVFSAYTNAEMLQYADVILPITPFSETAGSYVNLAGLWQTFNGVTRPLGDAKPAWKVLRVLANKLNLDGFDYDSIADVRSELTNLQDNAAYLNNQVNHNDFAVTKAEYQGLIRFAHSGIYNNDSITRRASALQDTLWAQQAPLSISAQQAQGLGLKDNDIVKVGQQDAFKELKLAVSATLPDRVVILAKHASTVEFFSNFAQIELIASAN